jgi:hypothetical protein
VLLILYDVVSCDAEEALERIGLVEELGDGVEAERRRDEGGVADARVGL